MSEDELALRGRVGGVSCLHTLFVHFVLVRCADGPARDQPFETRWFIPSRALTAQRFNIDPIIGVETPSVYQAKSQDTQT